MADKKPTQPAKINDISSPKASPNSRPIITNNGPKNDDPMLSTDGAENPQADMAVSKHKTVIQPLSETDTESSELKDDKAEAPEPAAAPAEEVTKSEADATVPAEAESEPDSEPDADQTVDSSDSIDESDQPASDDDSEESNGPNADKDNKAKDEAAKQAAEQERRDKYESMVASGKYALPIHQAGSRTWLVTLIIVLIIITVAIALDLLLDANILKIDDFSPPTNFFN